MAHPQLSSILDRSGHAATVAWAHDGSGDLASLPDADLAVEAAVALGNVAALQAVVAPKHLRKLAAAALHKLKSRGVKVAEVAAPRAFSLGAEDVQVPPRAFLSTPNALGNMHLVLTATDREGSCIMELVYGGSKLQDEHGHASRSELRQFWRELENDAGMTEIPFVTALHLGDALVQGKHAHGWDHLLEKVDSGTLTAARLLDPARQAPAPRGDDGDPSDWSLPAWLVDAKLVEDLAENGFGAHTAEDPDGWLNEGLDKALRSSRDEFAHACEHIALAFTLVGRPRAAAEAREVKRRIEAGESGRNFAQVRLAVLMACFDEIRRREAEHKADMDGLMQMVGRQGG